MSGPQSALEPHGPAAAAIVKLWWGLLALSTLVVLLVVGLLIVAAVRRREAADVVVPLPISPDLARKIRGERTSVEPTEGESVPLEQQVGAAIEGVRAVGLDTRETDRRSLRWILTGGLYVPAVILVALYGFTMHTLGVVEGRAEEPDLTIEVVGRQFWWEVHYLDEEGRRLFATANEIHIPVGRNVLLRLESADVIHSVWVPRLAGKMDMIPGRTNSLRIRADSPGVHRGQCAEYCGTQHAQMLLLVIAQEEAEFEAWLDAQRRPAAPPADSLARAGLEVYLRNACQACHEIRGVTQPGERIGPDLTHLASRRTIGAGILPNTRGHLGGWVANPQALKPGNLMPPVPLGAEDFTALVHYLESLR